MSAAYQQNPVQQYQSQPESSTMSFQSVSGLSGSQQPLNPYAAEYLNTVKENRSVYGNYLDNSYVYDPYKDKKTHFNVVTETDAYNPWGKPGGGAPKLDNNTGHVRTKIVGTLRWNLNGESEADRLKRMANPNRLAPSPSKNTLIYRKQPAQVQGTGNTPRSNQTTYNNSFREPLYPSQQQSQPPLQQQFQSASLQDLNNYNRPPPAAVYHYPPSTQAAPPPASLPPIQQSSNVYQTIANNPRTNEILTHIEREAHIRSLDRMNSNSMISASGGSFNSASQGGSIPKNLMPRRNEHELNRVSNRLYNDNNPSANNPNSPFWFGRTGTFNSTSLSSFNNSSSSTFVDVRRRKLLDTLENRQPTQSKFVTSTSNEYLPNAASQYVYPTSSNINNMSSHRNRYENPIPQI